MRLVNAEILKLVRRRGTMIWCLLLTVGSVIVTEVVLVTLHAVNGGTHGPAGGTTNLDHLVFVIGGLGTVASILIGAAAGTQDVSAGVFRDLVVTGRPRRTLFNVRFPGAVAVFMPILAIAFGIAVLCAYVFAGGTDTPSAGTIGHYAAYLVGVTGVNIAVALGLAAFASSRVVVGVLIAWVAIVAPLLQSIDNLGGVRKGSYVAAAISLLPASADAGSRIAMSSATAVVVFIAWTAVFLVAGRVWTERRSA
jgi:ABC-type transport system involved in multi-copper enzyme maturation permease subunit